MTPFEKHFIQVGVIGRPKGTKGLLRFHSLLNDYRDVNQFKEFYLDDEKIIELKLVSFDKKSPLITINEINNRTDIEKAIAAHGGPATVADRMGWTRKGRYRKPKGYWNSISNVKQEIDEFISIYDLPPGTLNLTYCWVSVHRKRQFK